MLRTKLHFNIGTAVPFIAALLVGLTTALALFFSIAAFFVAISACSFPFGYAVGTLSSLLGIPVGVTAYEVTDVLMESASEVIFRRREPVNKVA